MTQYNLSDKYYYNWVIPEEDPKALDNDRLLNVSLAIIDPDMTDQDIEYYLTYPPKFETIGL